MQFHFLYANPHFAAGGLYALMGVFVTACGDPLKLLKMIGPARWKQCFESKPCMTTGSKSYKSRLMSAVMLQVGSGEFSALPCERYGAHDHVLHCQGSPSVLLHARTRPTNECTHRAGRTAIPILDAIERCTCARLGYHAGAAADCPRQSATLEASESVTPGTAQLSNTVRESNKQMEVSLHFHVDMTP